MKIIIILKNYYRTLVWLLLMLYMLFSPGNALPQTKLFNIPYFDKVIHFGMFFLLVLLFLIDSEKLKRKFTLYVLFILAFLIFSALSEVIQSKYIAGRSGNIYDFLADFGGLITGTIFYFWPWNKLKTIFQATK